MNETDLCYTPATELARLIRAKTISPVEIAAAVLARLERLNPNLNAFLTVTADRARQEAKAAEARALRGERLSPLDGIPYSIKDLEPTAGIRTTSGSKFFEQTVPAEDGAVAARLRASGGVLLGKTNTPHIGHKDMCDNLLGEPCKTPWHLERTSGGSSGGAGAAVAAGIGPVAHGSDGAGSIRIPSSLCGIYGLKPSFGRVPYHPNPNYWNARSHNGPMTRTVRDAAMLLQLMAGPDPRDPLTIDQPPPDFLAACEGDLKGLRVAWSGDLGFARCDPEVRALAHAAAKRLAEAGCTVEEPAIDWGNPDPWHRLIYQAAVASRVANLARQRPDWIEPSLQQMVDAVQGVSAIELHQALNERAPFYNRVRAFFETYDLLLTPGMPCGAWPATPGAVQGPPDGIEGKPALTIFERVPFFYPFNLTGQPAAVVPCGFTAEGLPVALQIVGRWHDDATVLRASACFEAIQPWAQHRPPVD